MTAAYDLAIVGGTVVLPDGSQAALSVGIHAEQIAALMDPSEPVEALRTIDARGKVVLPGVIDPHTHIGYEGYRGIPLDALPSHFETETASALVGGVTTLICTYRNAPSYEEIFEEMRAAGERHSRIDFAYSLGITNDAQLPNIQEYHRDFGVTSFKFYMAYRGAEAKATGNVYNNYDDGLMLEGMRAIADIPGGMAMVHAENIEIINRIRPRLQSEGRDDLAAWSLSRPDYSESESVRRATYLGEIAGCPVYVPHLTCRRSLEVVAEHRSRGTNPVYVETCAQYLTHTMDSPVGLLGKVNPPLRTLDDLDALWDGLVDGSIDTVATDHCGIPAAAKGPDIWTAVPGFAGMATLLPVLLDSVARGRVSLATVAEVTSHRTARLFNLAPRKGAIALGSDADLVIADLDLTRTVKAEELLSRSDFSIYEGMQLTGWPITVLVRGQIAMDGGKIVAEPGNGRYLTRYLVTQGADT